MTMNLDKPPDPVVEQLRKEKLAIAEMMRAMEQKIAAAEAKAAAAKAAQGATKAAAETATTWGTGSGTAKTTPTAGDGGEGSLGSGVRKSGKRDTGP